MTIRKLLGYCILISLNHFICLESFAQCDAKFDYKVEVEPTGSKQILINSNKGQYTARVQLYDLNAGKVAEEKNIKITSRFELAFTNVKPSFYLMYVWLSGCPKPTVLSEGKEGILIEN